MPINPANLNRRIGPPTVGSPDPATPSAPRSLSVGSAHDATWPRTDARDVDPPSLQLKPPSCRPADFKERAFPTEHLPAGFYSPDALKPGEVVLTFDDGPNAHTPAIL